MITPETAMTSPKYHESHAMTAPAFEAWLQVARHGDSVVYGRSARGVSPDGPGFSAAWKAHQAGLVALVTRRAKPNRKIDYREIEYIAQRRVTG